MKKTNSKPWYIIKIVIYILLGLLPVIFYFLAFTEAFGKQLCENNSTCYALIAFLGGLIVALKIKILDSKKSITFEKRVVELVFFVLGIVVNVLFLAAAYWQECLEDNKGSLLMLNATIWLDFIVFARNIAVVVFIYLKDLATSSGKRQFKSKDPSNDLFVRWLKRENKSDWVKRALTDKTYKRTNSFLKTEETNYSLASLGDSILKCCLSLLLFDKAEKISEELVKYVSDEFLVKNVAAHYDLLKYIKKDTKDNKMPNDYAYEHKKGNNPRKYIAIAVEAMVGAIYLETRDMNAITGLIDNWKAFKNPVDSKMK